MAADPAPSPAATVDGDERLQAALGHRFRDRSLLERALTHRSWCAEHDGEESNERLEFLGDAVLGQIVTDHLYRTYDWPEGELAKTRAGVVSSEALAEVAAELDLGAGLRLGKGERSSGGRSKRSILADAMEAVIGAVYLDGGQQAASALVHRLLDDRIAAAAAGPGGGDFKTQLQELAARHLDRMPRYVVVDEGPDHAKRFFATVHLNGEPRGWGEGASKKAAEQAAAAEAWSWLARAVVDMEERGSRADSLDGGIDA